ncbi:hypothetical protein [Neofamilia massiliensis]|uniref:hypothetical protein n=1 Tax=Neofamilia massiliensis TaxID=1673724 RepID=UPI0006BB6AD5|nr:hypothetical protein [Neofamilia massiliensis]
MKKIYFVLAFLLVLTSCKTNKVDQEAKIQEASENTEIEKQIETGGQENKSPDPETKTQDQSKMQTIKIKSGPDLAYEKISVDLVSSDLDLIPLDLNEKGQDLVIEALKSLEEIANEEADHFAEDLEEGALKINLSDSSYLSILNGTNYDGYYYYLYYEDDKAQRYFRSENNLKDDLLEAIFLGQLLDQGLIDEKIPYEDYGQIKINALNPVAEFFEGDTYSVVGSYECYYYSLDQGIFENTAGSVDTFQISYKLDQGSYKFSSYRDSSMGSYENTLREFSRGFNDLAIELSNKRKPDEQIFQRIYKKASDLGLENFVHEIDKIPGYEDGVIFIDDTEEVPKDSVLIAKEDEYKAALGRLGKENWTYVEGLIYYKPCEIAIKTIIDDFEGAK